MRYDECMQRCLSAGGTPRPPITVNFAPVEQAALELVAREPGLAAWMRRVELNPASGTDALLATAAAVAERDFVSVEA